MPKIQPILGGTRSVEHNSVQLQLIYFYIGLAAHTDDPCIPRTADNRSENNKTHPCSYPVHHRTDDRSPKYIGIRGTLLSGCD